MGDFVGDQAGAAGRSRVGGEKLTDWWARLSRLNQALSPDLVASILAAGDGPPPNPPVVLPTLQFLVAFNNGPLDDPASITTVASPAGSLGGANVWTDISPWVMGYQRAGGRQHELDQFEAAEVTLDLNNQDGRFNPWNTSSPYAGLLTLRKPLQVRVTANGSTFTRFTGHVDAWPTVWSDPVTHFAQLHATDAMRLLQLAEVTTAGYETQVLADSPAAYWRLGDTVGSIWALDASGNGNKGSLPGAAQGYTNDLPVFGSAGLLPAEPGSSATLTVTGSDTQSLFRIPDNLVSGSSLTAEFWFRSTATTGVASSPQAGLVLSFIMGAAQRQVSIQVQNSPYSHGVSVYDNSGSPTPTEVVHYAPFLYDGESHHIALTISSTAGYVLYVDGVSVSTSASTPGAFPGVLWSSIESALFSPGCEMQEVALYPSILTGTQIAKHYSLASFPQQSTDARVGAILDAIKWPSGARDLDAGVSDVQAVTSSLVTTSSLSHMQDCQATEGGALYMGPDGKVNFRSRQTLWSGTVYQTSQATFGDGVGDIPWVPTPNLALDDIDLFNEARGQRTGGNVQVADDQTSIDTYGRSTWSPKGQLLGISDSEVLGMCQAVVNDHKTPQSRLQSLDVNLAGLGAAQQQTVLGLGLLYRITAERSGVPGTAFSQVGLIEHIAETATPGQWTITFGLDTTATGAYWVLGTSQLGVDTRLGW